MHRFGFKIVDRDAAEIAPVIDYALAHQHPIEVGLYFGNPAARAVLEQELSGAGLPIFAHTPHESVHADNLDRKGERLAAHIAQAKALGSRYSILHTAALPLSQRLAQRPRVISRLLDGLAHAEELCERLDYRVHLENTFHCLDFYRDLLAGVRSRDFRRIHFCFDIGHAKVWSRESLDEWMSFLAELESEGFALHFHLHANDGLADQHLSVAETIARGIASGEPDYNAYGYPAAYWELERRFPAALKVFEVKPAFAIANLQAVEAAAPLR